MLVSRKLPVKCVMVLYEVMVKTVRQEATAITWDQVEWLTVATCTTGIEPSKREMRGLYYFVFWIFPILPSTIQNETREYKYALHFYISAPKYEYNHVILTWKEWLLIINTFTLLWHSNIEINVFINLRISVVIRIWIE